MIGDAEVEISLNLIQTIIELCKFKVKVTQAIKLYNLLYCESLSTACRRNCISNKFDVEKFYISICIQSQRGRII